MLKIDYSSLNLNAFIERELKQRLPLSINNIFISNNGFLNIVTNNGAICCCTSTTAPYLFFSDKIYSKRKLGFNDAVSKLLKGAEIVSVGQIGYDRIIKFTMNSGCSLIILLIPGQFNIVITNEESRILNIYSYKKDKEGKLLYNISDEYIVKSNRIDPEDAVDAFTRSLVVSGAINKDELFSNKLDFALLKKGATYRIPPLSSDIPNLFSSFYISDILNFAIMHEEKSEMENLFDKKRAGIEKKIHSLKSKIAVLANEDETIEEINKKIRKADFLKANLHKIGKDAGSIHLKHNGEDYLLSIPKSFSPHSYMVFLYESIKKLKENLKNNRITIEKYWELIAELQKSLTQTEQIISYTKPSSKKKEKKSGRFYKSPSGLTVVSGRNASENDTLLKSAKSGDIYFHANEAHGSVVILKKDAKTSTKQDIEYAASIAAYFSEGKHSSLVEVAYEDVKYVVKRKGDPKGMAHMLRNRTVFVKPAEIH